VTRQIEKGEDQGSPWGVQQSEGQRDPTEAVGIEEALFYVEARVGPHEGAKEPDESTPEHMVGAERHGEVMEEEVSDIE